MMGAGQVSFQVPAGPPPVASPPDVADDLVVATPERVAFRFETAGLGSRFVAQVIDLLLVSVAMAALGIVGAGVSALMNDATVAVLVFGLGEFVLLVAFWTLPEALWSGRTPGKRVMHLRRSSATCSASSTSCPSTTPSARS